VLVCVVAAPHGRLSLRSCCASRQQQSRRDCEGVTGRGAVTALGGIIGYALVDQLYDYLPFF
jgi:zinc and cadmium transporter